MNTKKEYHVPALEKASSILEYLAKQEQQRTLNDICEALQLPRTTVFSILCNLIELGYARKSEDGRFHLGLGLYSLGMEAARQMNVHEVFTPELTVLRDELKQTVYGSCYMNGETILLEKLDGSGGIIFKSHIGESKPLHLSSGGKAILAWIPRGEFEIYMEKPLERRTPNTLYRREQLEECRKKVRTEGYSVDDEENEPGVFCFGAPVFSFGRTIFGCVSLSTLKGSISISSFNSYIQKVMLTAERISRKLGYDGIYPPSAEPDNA